MNIMKNKLLFTVARIQNCWEHHQDGSDLLRSHQSHLFSLSFNDLKHSVRGVDISPTWWVDKYEEENVKNILKQDFKEYWNEINILEIRHAAIMRSDGILETAKSHPEIIKRCPYGTCKAGSTMGFVTSTGKFIERKEALKIALDSKQIDPDMDTIRQSGLISENLWSDSGFEYDPVKGYYKENETLSIKTW